MFTRWYPKFHHNLHSWGSSYRSKWAINFGRSSRFMRREIPYTGLDKKLGDCEVPMYIMKIDCLCEIPSWLVVWNIFYFPFHIWDVILPIDELIFFRGVGIPATRYRYISHHITIYNHYYYIIPISCGLSCGLSL